LASKEYKLMMHIYGRVDKSLPASVASAKATLAGFNSAFTTMDKGYAAIMTAGRTAFRAIATAATIAAAAVALIGKNAIQSGMEMETAFAQVKKTTEATAQQYKELKQDIFEMMKDTPANFETIASTMATGGQLGINVESLSDFTQVMTDIGLVANDISADDAATNFARLQNILGFADTDDLGVSNWERLGSTLLTLGNTFATTEGAIAPMAMRLAATGKQVNLSAAQILGLSTAMSSVGIKEAVGGSTMSKLLKKMQLAVETYDWDAGDGSLNDYADVSGMSALQFAATFKDDAAEGIKAFIGGLSGMLKGGKDLSGILEKLGMNVELTADDLQELGLDEETAVSTLDEMGLNEIRLSNTILALAGGYDTLVEALDSANQAWDENTGLARYTAPIYETVESKIQLMKNSLQTTSDTIYQNVKEPLGDVIEWLTDKFYGINDYLGSNNGLRSWIEKGSEALPTIKRDLSNFLEIPLTAIRGGIEWIVKNKSNLIGVIAGIGTALVTYKILSSLNQAAQSIKTIINLLGSGPAGWIIGGIVAVVAAIVGGVTAVEAKFKELGNLNLDDHFGNIRLSLKDLDEIASHLVSTQALEGVRASLESFNSLESIEGTISGAVDALNKYNFKVSINMDLSESEMEDYKAQIDTFIEGMQDYVVTQHQAVKIGLEIVDWEDEELGGNVESKLETFYRHSEGRMSTLGMELAAAVNAAFADGILDPNEIEAIGNLQKKMAEVQQRIAQGETQARLEIIGANYGEGTKHLSKESYQNLWDSVNNEIETANADWDKWFVEMYGGTASAYDNLNDPEFLAAVDQYKQTMMAGKQESMSQAYGTLIDAVFSNYSDVLTNDVGSYKAQISQLLSESFLKGDILSGSMLSEALGMDKEQRGAFSILYESMAPALENLRSMVDENGNLPADIQELVDQILLIGALGSDEGAQFELAGITDGNNPLLANIGVLTDYVNGILESGTLEDYHAAEGYLQSYIDTLGQSQEDHTGELEQAYSLMHQLIANEGNALQTEAEAASNNVGQSIDQGVADGINANSAAFTAADELREKLAAQLETPLNVTMPVNVTVEANVDDSSLPTGVSVTGHAAGGFVNRPELSWVGEEGPEAIIPLDGSSRAYDLLAKTNELMGMKSRVSGVDLGGSSSPTINYNPTLQFYGDSPSRQDMVDALEISESKFEQMMNNYLKNNARVAF